MFKSYCLISLLITLLFLFPINTFAAEVQHVKSATLLQIGDRNRTFSVKLACLEVDPSFEEEAIIWLKSELRRKRRVNFNPKGVNNGILLARVSLLESKIDLSQSLAEKGLGKITC